MRSNFISGIEQYRKVNSDYDGNKKRHHFVDRRTSGKRM